MKKLLLTCTDLMAIQFLVPHVKHLAQNGYAVELVCSDVGGRLEELRTALDGVAAVHPARLVRSPFSPENRKGYADLKAALRAEHWDAVWTNEPVMGVMTRLAARSSRRAGTKVLYMVHGFHFYRGAPKRNWLLYYPVERLLSRVTDVIVTINAEDFTRASTFHAGKVQKISGVGVNLDQYAPNPETRREYRAKLGLAENDFVLLTVGELSARKNQHVLLEALAALHDPGIKLILCGKGDLEQPLRDYVKEHGLERQVMFLGYRKDVGRIFCAADVFVFSSLHEGLPKALMEAMASGLPVVCSNIRGNVDLIEDGKGGRVVENKAESFKAAISELQGDCEMRKRMGTQNCRTVRNFREELALTQMEAVLRDML